MNIYEDDEEQYDEKVKNFLEFLHNLPNEQKRKEEEQKKTKEEKSEEENRTITTYEQIEEYLPEKKDKEDLIKLIKELCDEIDSREKSYNDLKKAVINKYGKDTLSELNNDIDIKTYIIAYYDTIETDVAKLKTRDEFIDYIKALCKDVDKRIESDWSLHLAVLDKFGQDETDILEGFDRAAWEAEEEEEEEDNIDGTYIDENKDFYRMIQNKKYMEIDYWTAANCFQIFNMPFYALNRETEELTLVKTEEDMQNAKSFTFYMTPEDYYEYEEAYTNFMGR